MIFAEDRAQAHQALLNSILHHKAECCAERRSLFASIHSRSRWACWPAQGPGFPTNAQMDTDGLHQYGQSAWNGSAAAALESQPPSSTASAGHGGGSKGAKAAGATAVGGAWCGVA